MTLLNRMATISQELWGKILPSSLSNQVTKYPSEVWDKDFPTPEMAPCTLDEIITRKLISPGGPATATGIQEYNFFHSILFFFIPSTHQQIQTTSSSKNILSRVPVMSQYTSPCGNIIFPTYSPTHFHVFITRLRNFPFCTIEST